MGEQPPISLPVTAQSLFNGGGATTLTFGNKYGKSHGKIRDNNQAVNAIPMNINQSGANVIHPIRAISLFAILAFGSIQLKINGLVGEVGFIPLLIASMFCGLAVYFGGRLKKLGPSSIELHEAVKEVKDAESSVKILAAATLEMIESDEGGYKNSSWDSDRYAKAKAQLKKLVG